ncbi:Aste57867_20041 [Aphanomyces stellatus]|uniref:Aste57867_20041 protein n=1 Tax=Aphanomyces stellatus TaxID=120398 RepID=A0A485LE62_9STRA|nr:hypothetical protein As57867_019975 [Aphanomyces stellatus]VFT96737.1 Aste57867_20041 [Aphanomyces stellatus]
MERPARDYEETKDVDNDNTTRGEDDGRDDADDGGNEKDAEKESSAPRRPPASSEAPPPRPKRSRRRKEERLEGEVAHIQREIHRLEGKRDCMLDYPLQSTTLNDRHSTKIMLDYCKLFEYGFTLHNDQESWRQEQFLRSVMREDLRIVGMSFSAIGLDKLIGAHRLYSVAHVSYSLTFIHCENILDDVGAVLVCELKTVATQRITHKMLQLYYPSVLEHEELLDRLVGQMIDITVTQFFEFDNLGRIEAYVPRIEVFQAFADLLVNTDLGVLCSVDHKLRNLFQ